jgi:hypothetical protein
MRGRIITLSALAVMVLAVTIPTTQRAHADKAATMTAIALAESGGNSRSTKSKGLKASKKTGSINRRPAK